MTKPKILIICPFYPPNLGGVETHLQLLTNHLSKNQYPTTVLSYKPITTKVDGYIKHEKQGYIDIHRYWWPGFGLFDKTTPYPILQFLYIVPGLLFHSLSYALKNNQNIDVIHTHGFAAAFIGRIISLFFPHKRLVVSTHFIYQKLSKDSFSAKIFKWTFDRYDKILLVSQKSGAELKHIGLRSEKMEIFHHWLDQDIFKPASKSKTRTSLQLPINTPIVLFVGRIIRMKGVFELLKAAAKLPQVQFICIGDGPDMPQLKTAARLIKNFKLIGKISHVDTIKYYNSADIFILPSQSDEAQPVTIMEALSCACPVISTNKGAVASMFSPKCGISISPTVSNIKNAISNLLSDQARLHSMSLAARKYALKHYSAANADIITKSYHAQY